MLLTNDRVSRETLGERLRFTRASAAERQYVSQLRKVARVIGGLVDGFDLDDLSAVATLQDALNRYSTILRPWARATAGRMLAEVSRKDTRVWASLARTMGRTLRKEIESAPTGIVLRGLMDEQVALITSLPIDAGRRVHELALRSLSTSERPGVIAKEIERSGEVAASRATLIARTEVGRASTNLTAARAQYVGSTHFVWRSAGDSDVRPLHKELNGKAFRWDEPPVAGERGERSLPGAIYNCRCYPEPILPETFA